jgi:hypothetical protein
MRVLSSRRLEVPVARDPRLDGSSPPGWLLVSYFLVAGLFLLLVPWTTVWTWNPLLRSIPGLASIGLSPYLRGAVSGLGAFLVVVGLLDLHRVFGSPDGTPPGPEPARRKGDSGLPRGGAA